MTLGEIYLVIKANIDEAKEKQAQNNTTVYNIAYLTSAFVGSILAGKKVPTIDEIFPTEENIKARKEMEMNRLKAQFAAFASGHNAQMEVNK